MDDWGTKCNITSDVITKGVFNLYPSYLRLGMSECQRNNHHNDHQGLRRSKQGEEKSSSHTAWGASLLRLYLMFIIIITLIIIPNNEVTVILAEWRWWPVRWGDSWQCAEVCRQSEEKCGRLEFWWRWLLQPGKADHWHLLLLMAIWKLSHHPAYELVLQDSDPNNYWDDSCPGSCQVNRICLQFHTTLFTKKGAIKWRIQSNTNIAIQNYL